MYKVLTKIIVARLRPFLGKLISPLQMAFVPGRKGMDNVIIAQEIIHSLSRKKGNTGYMAIKIDLEKAYDKLEWSFIRDTLIRFNLPRNLVELIMSCVSSVSTSILFNGGTLDSFKPSRGIRQGDPLSPYIFIMCMDYLGQLIQEKCATKAWSPVKASRSGPAFSHLSSQTTWFCLRELILKIVQQLEEFWMIFAVNRGKPSVRPNLGSFSLLIWIKTIGMP